MTFEEKVKSMSAKEIITAMVDSLVRPPIVNVDMSTYGDAYQKKFLGFIPYGKPVCFGCAATNTICKIAGITFTPENIIDVSKRAEAVGVDWGFLEVFEIAINSLRIGDISDYNYRARANGFAEIKSSYASLPVLNDNYTNSDLDKYRNLAKIQ